MVHLSTVKTRRDDAPAFWFVGILWIILIDGEETDGRYSLMEQLMPQGSGPGPHLHPFNDEGFYVLDGAMTMTVGGHGVDAQLGSSVWIPRGTVHAFEVTTTTCRVLNSFAPAGMEQLIKTLGVPATARTLPPEDVVADPEKVAAFVNNYWGMAASVSPATFDTNGVGQR